MSKFRTGVIFIVFLCFLSGCNGTMGSCEKKAADVAEKIVCAFDNRNAEELKSVFNKDAIVACPQIESDIEKAFNFYKGKSTQYTINVDSVNTTIDNRNIQRISHDTIRITTDSDVYIIQTEYLVYDKNHPRKQGVYGIKILPASIFPAYYAAAEGDTNKMNQMEEELPEEILAGAPDKGYLQFGMGVFTYTAEDIEDLYYQKNGKPMLTNRSNSDVNTEEYAESAGIK